MKKRSRFGTLKSLGIMKKNTLVLLIVVMAMFHSEAHVALLNPSGGETFYPGETVTIEWQELISHNTSNWDLYFSSDGGLTWDIIQIDIPLVTFSYQWTIPVTQTTQGRIKIVQDNVDSDYDDVSDNFTISTIADINTHFEEIEIDVYPNPFTDFSILEFENPGHNTYKLILSDTKGRLVRTITNITTNKVKIKRNNLTSGIYIFQLYTDEEVRAIGKLVIE